MELDITSLLELDAFNLSHSMAEGGENAGQNTWNAAKEQAEETPLLSTPEHFEAFRDYVKEFGAWEDDEIAAWSDQECNALLLQFIAGDIREAGADSLDEIDWETYEADENKSGRLYRSGDSVFFYLGN